MIESIKNWEIENAREVLRNHTVDPLTKEGALENLYFCITSQATPWEIPTKIVNRLREKSYPGDPVTKGKYSSWNVLTDNVLVNDTIRECGWRFHHHNRIDESLDYFVSRNDDWWKEIPKADAEEREKYVNQIKWLSRKTFSFWNICLGGRDLLALDVHIMRGLSKIGMEVNRNYFIPVARKKGSQIVRRTPGKEDYLRIEDEARSFFSKDERFIVNGNVDLGLVDSLLWWRGASRGELYQPSLFDCNSAIGRDMSYTLPYAKNSSL